MYQYYQGHTVITVNDWVASGLSIDMFKRDSIGDDLQIVRRGIHGNTLIDVRSIRRLDRRAKIEAAYGQIEDERNGLLVGRIQPDQKAKGFFDEYTYGDNKHLEDRLKTTYCNNAAILNMLRESMERCRVARASAGKQMPYGKFMEAAVAFSKKVSDTWPNSLPSSTKRLNILFKQYLKDGYTALISGKLGNTTAEKLSEEGQRWVLARWASPISRLTLGKLFDDYNAQAAEAGWKPLKSEQTLYNFLNKPEIKRLWYGARYGELKAKEHYVPQNRTLLASCRDANWYGDGTKLNYFYRDENGKVATCNVYEVIDEYSECLLGFAISKSEDFAVQYKAYRMALNFAGQKPFQITFDNQGGHKKLMAEEFFGKLSRLAVGTQPYNGKSKTIESVFKRLQEQHMRQDWFFTGMNITAHKAESRANMEFFEANKANLPTLEEVVKRYEQRRTEWNHAPHPKTGRPRIEMYYSSHNDQCKPLQVWERIELFGLTTAKPVTFRADGLTLTVQGVKYAYDVLDNSGFTDMDFRKKHTGGKFLVSYDPEDLSRVVLMEQTPDGGRKFVAVAEKYIQTHRAKQDQDDIDRLLLAKRDALNKAMRAETQDEIEAIMEVEGVHPAQHGLDMPRVRMNKGKRKADTDGYGSYTKTVSNLVPAGIDEDETDSFSGY